MYIILTSYSLGLIPLAGFKLNHLRTQFFFRYFTTILNIRFYKQIINHFTDKFYLMVFLSYTLFKDKAGKF